MNFATSQVPIKWLTLVALLALPAVSLAQIHPTIRSGRPGQAIGPYVTGRGLFQLQSGIDLYQTKNSTKTNTYLSNTVIRHGFSENFEASGVFNYQSDNVDQSSQNGVSDLQIGFRYNIIDTPRGLVPGLGVQTRFRLTNVSENYRRQNVAPIFILAIQHQISETLSLTNNFGLSYNGLSAEPTHSFISNLSFPIIGNWGGFIEVYGNETNGLNSQYGDGGLSYLVHKDLQIDLSAGGGKNHGTTESFISVGVSWRTNVLNLKPLEAMNIATEAHQ